MGTVDTLLVKRQREGRALVMGVLNTTPDSFSDGGEYLQPSAATRRVDELIAQGADIIDIGGESSRPGAPTIAAGEQIRRIEAALKHAVGLGSVVSIDTTSADVARFALEHGAQLVNDVSCLAEPALARVTAARGAKLILMHSRGPMSQMPGFSQYPRDGYDDVVREVAAEWRVARERAEAEGLQAQDCWFDPGLGFAKNAEHCIQLLARLDELASLSPVLVLGPSRKSFIGALDGAGPSERLGGTVAACLAGVDKGARVLRVHDVHAVRQALSVRRAIDRGTMEEPLRA
ncbi:MAG: dihydropteroate synthase [Polyangiaceae bacterium]